MLRIIQEDSFFSDVPQHDKTTEVYEEELFAAANKALRTIAASLMHPDRSLTVEMARAVIEYMKRILEEQEVVV